jgi:ATP-dependent protease ClpP protease subunit
LAKIKGREEMKILVVAFATMFLLVGLSYAEPPEPVEEPEKETLTRVEELCFFAGMETNCMNCHTKSGTLKEMEMFDDKEPPYGCQYKWDVDGTLIGYMEISSISPYAVENMLEYFDQDKNVNKIVFNVFSPGGSVFHAWKMINIIQRYYDRFEIEMRCDSAAFSAGFLIFLAGEKRYVSPYAALMMHELKSFAFFTIKSPSGLTEEAELFNKWQLVIDKWIAERTDIDLDTIEENTYKRDWWMDGREAVELGVAHGLLK